MPVALLLMQIPANLAAQEIHSASIDRTGDRIVVKGAAFTGSTEFRLGGVDVATANVTANQLDIPFSEAVATAAQWRGSYRLTADDGAFITVFIAAPINDPTSPPQPPPPSGGPDCPCIAGWEASTIPKDNFTWCVFDYTSQQQSISGQRGAMFISTAFDPFNILFDEANPGNSVSYCALHDGTSWTVAEPVVNQDQFDDCDHYMWRKICI